MENTLNKSHTELIGGLYLGILENNFGFKDVNYLDKDVHAYYFEERATGKAIKVITDADVLEVHEESNDNWNYIGIII